MRTFQYFCISNYEIFRPGLRNERVKLILHRSFTIVHFLALILCGAYFFFQVAVKFKSNRMKQYNTSPVFMFVSVATKFIFVFSFVAIPTETLFRHRTEYEIFETFQCIDDIFQKKLKYSIDYRVHRRRQMGKCWLSFVGFSIVIISSISANMSLVELNVFFGTLVQFYVFVMSRMRLFQITFYIDALRDLLIELKTMMRRQQHRVKYNSAQWQDIQYCRKIYTNISLLRTLIGNCFGYSMILLVIDSAVRTLNSAYWFYLNAQSLNSSILHIRKFDADLNTIVNFSVRILR